MGTIVVAIFFYMRIVPCPQLQDDHRTDRTDRDVQPPDNLGLITTTTDTEQTIPIQITNETAI